MSTTSFFAPVAAETGEAVKLAMQRLCTLGIDDLLMLTLSLEPDRGMPGDTPEDRAATSIAALLAFLQHGHTSSSGAFREHVARIIAFLESLTGLRPDRQKLVGAALAFARKGKAPAEDWLTTAASGAKPWARIEKALPPS